MNNQTILNQFLDALENSRSFQQMSMTQKAEIRKSYLEASDEKILEALSLLEQNEVIIQTLTTKNSENNSKKIVLAQEIHKKVKQLEKVQLRSTEKKENSKAQQTLAQLEKTLNEPTPKPKRKKWFFGLF